MDFPIVDFDPHEDLHFPRPVEQKYQSGEFMAHIAAYEPAPGKTALWHLGQNAWILKGPATASGPGRLVAIDPYLTDFAASKRTKTRVAKSRLLPIFIEPEDLKVDVVVLTHSHIDHADPFTLERLTIKKSARFLAPWQTLKVMTDAGIPVAQQTMMHPLQTETVAFGDGVPGIEFTGTFAEPTDFTDLNHMGFVMRFPGGKAYYNSGDTAQSSLLEHVKSFHPEVMSICINGGYHNLSHWEAAEITALVHPKVVLPAHYDMMPHNLQSPHMFRKSLYEKTKAVQYHRLEYYTAFEF
ncbi:MAG: MBL fold metallo-hydrolase [Spirochaetales bacterium]